MWNAKPKRTSDKEAFFKNTQIYFLCDSWNKTVFGSVYLRFFSFIYMGPLSLNNKSKTRLVVFYNKI